MSTPTLLPASLWIKPTGSAREACRDACERARARHGGPRIEPHITLLGGIEIAAEDAESRLKQLSSQIEPFEIRFTGIGRGERYFHRLFAVVEASPALRNARRLAESLFQPLRSADFAPHLSLVYGDEALPDDAVEGFEALVGLCFTIESLHLVHTDTGAGPDGWRELAERTLRPISGTE